MQRNLFELFALTGHLVEFPLLTFSYSIQQFQTCTRSRTVRYQRAPAVASGSTLYMISVRSYKILPTTEVAHHQRIANLQSGATHPSSRCTPQPLEVTQLVRRDTNLPPEVTLQSPPQEVVKQRYPCRY